MPTDPDDKPPSPVSRALDEAKARAERLAAEAALDSAKKRATEAAEGALDAVERMLFGKVGGAEEVLRREATADPLERLRQQYATGEAKPAADASPAAASPSAARPAAPPKEDKEAVARRQLEELKRQYAAKKAADAEAADAAAEGLPKKRTL